MPAPKGNKNAKGNPGGGRHTTYKPEYAELGRKVALLGATDAELATVFDVCETTINAWKREHVEFREALKSGKMVADANVADRLYKRAMGYTHDAVKIFANPSTGAEQIVPYTEHYAPDTTAAIFWLKNRQRDKWRDKQDLEHTGANGGPIEQKVDATVAITAEDAYLRMVKGKQRS
jgi:hypothetical protein